ncbi:MAG: TylF/MycF/NovP-related O-methyltransferase [Planctomycetota bacterium]
MAEDLAPYTHLAERLTCVIIRFGKKKCVNELYKFWRTPMGSRDSAKTIILLDDWKWRYWTERAAAVRAGLEKLIPAGHSFIFVGEHLLDFQIVGDRRALPFLERDGCYWGPPADDATAISEFERMCGLGADFIAFAWMNFWWLDYYAEFRRYLCSKFPCMVHRGDVDNVDLVVFDLRRRGSPSHAREWVSRGANLLVFRRLVPERELTAKYREALLTLTSERGPAYLGDYLEFGVSIGTSLACMFRVLKELGYTGSRLFGFDSFEGLPETALTDDGPWKPKQYACDIEISRQFLTEKGIDWNRVFLIKGWFSDTLNPAVVESYGIRKASIIMVDCDLYSSALQALRFGAPLILDEAIIFFDDWNSDGLAEKNLGEKRAFTEFLTEHPCFEVADFGSYSEDAAVFHVTRKNRGHR